MVRKERPRVLHEEQACNAYMIRSVVCLGSFTVEVEVEVYNYTANLITIKHS